MMTSRSDARCALTCADGAGGEFAKPCVLQDMRPLASRVRAMPTATSACRCSHEQLNARGCRLQSHPPQGFRSQGLSRCPSLALRLCHSHLLPPFCDVLAHASLREDFMSMPTNRRCLVAFLVLALLMPYARAFVGLVFQVGVAAFLRSAR